MSGEEGETRSNSGQLSVIQVSSRAGGIACPGAREGRGGERLHGCYDGGSVLQ